MKQQRQQRRRLCRHLAPLSCGSVPFVQLFCLFLRVQLLLLDQVVTAVPIQLYGINYNNRQGADWNPNKCKGRDQIKRDLLLLRKLTNRIRILSLADCGQAIQVLDVAKELGMQVLLGMWVSEFDYVFEEEKSTLQEMLNQGLLDDTSTVLGITVGSEAIYREEVTARENINLKQEVREITRAAGRGDIPISIVDIAPTYEFSPILTDNVDMVVTNSFPFWESINIERATDYLLEEIGPIINRARDQGKQVILGETGWPSDGFLEGVSLASPELQAEYFRQFYCRMDKELGWSYYYFTGIDNAWRQEQDPENTIEGNWGFFTWDLVLKPHFQNMAFTCPGSSVEYTFSEIDFPASAPTAPPPPTSSNTDPSCSAHSQCVGLLGNCCPTFPGGSYLLCCDSGDVTNPVTAPPLPPPPTPAPVVLPPPPVTPAPVTPAPVVLSPPVTPAPVTSRPPTSTPLTPAPVDVLPPIVTTNAPTKAPTTLAPVVDAATSMPTTNPTTIPTTTLPTKLPSTAPILAETMVPTTLPVANSVPPTGSPTMAATLSPTLATSTAAPVDDALPTSSSTDSNSTTPAPQPSSNTDTTTTTTNTTSSPTTLTTDTTTKEEPSHAPSVAPNDETDAPFFLPTFSPTSSTSIPVGIGSGSTPSISGVDDTNRQILSSDAPLQRQSTTQAMTGRSVVGALALLPIATMLLVTLVSSGWIGVV